jgi:hypothetical protein
MFVVYFRTSDHSHGETNCANGRVTQQQTYWPSVVQRSCRTKEETCTNDAADTIERSW